MDIATILNLIGQGVVLIPKFQQLWSDIRADYSQTDQAAVDAALEAIRAKDAADTAQADVDLDAASKK